MVMCTFYTIKLVITFGRIKRDHQTQHDSFYIAISWVRLFAGEAGTSAILSWVGLGVFLHLPSWLCGRGLVRSLGLGVLNTASCCGVGLLALFWTSSCFGLGVRCLSTGAGAVSLMLDDSTFVFIVFVLRGALCRSHVPTNSPHGLFDDRGIPGKICPRSLLIGWVNPSKVDGLYRQVKIKTLSVIDYKYCIFCLCYAERHTDTRVRGLKVSSLVHTGSYFCLFHYPDSLTWGDNGRQPWEQGWYAFCFEVSISTNCQSAYSVI